MIDGTAEPMIARVHELARACPELTQRELAARLGISRDMVGYYLRRGQGLARPSAVRYRQRRTEHHVAMRQVAAQAVREAFPHLRTSEIALALGLSRHQARFYLAARPKARRPAWAATLLEACRALQSTQPARAADAFQRLAAELTGGATS